MESEKMFDQYMSNLMSYVKINEAMQKQLIPNKQGLINKNSININNNFFYKGEQNKFGNGNPMQFKDDESDEN
jgi:hypothetical protein